ncbi:MAG: hypothetical protein ACOY4R_28680 [Pseudomonadota bacterium]
MFRHFPRLLVVAAIGMTAAACQGDTYPTPRGYYQPAPVAYGNPYYNSGYYAPPPARYGYAQPGPYYYNNANQQGGHGWYNRADGRRYTTVTVTNRGQNGYRDDVVQQQVVCGSQYYDGYQTRTAPSC